MGTTTKRTAANSALLAYAKKLFNAPAYKCAMELMNNSGKDACVDFLVALFREDVRETKRAELTAL